GLAQEQVAVRVVQREGEQVQHLLLQLGLEIDQQVSANHQVNAREWHAAPQVLLAEDDHLAQRLRDAEAMVNPFEETLAVIIRQVLQHVGWVKAAPREVDGAFIEVGGENLDVPLGKFPS